KIIAQIGSTFYDVYGSLFTVPGGITNQQVQFQVNLADISGNAGQFTFDVTVCNNQAAPWAHTLNVRLSPYGFNHTSDGGLWLGGEGFHTTDEPTSPNEGSLMVFQRMFTQDVDFTRFTLTFNATLGACNGDCYESIGWLDSGVTYHELTRIDPADQG